MTSLFRAKMTDVTILNGATLSRVIKVDEECYDAEAIVVQAPVDTDSKTYTWLVSQDNSNWATLQDPSSTNIAVPGAGLAIIYNGILTAAKYLQLKASSATSKDVTFKFDKSTRE